MTLRCKNCNGEVKAIQVNKNENSVFEKYRCQSCGETGSYTKDFETGRTHKTNLIDR